MTFRLKDDNGKLWLKVISATFLDAVATVNDCTEHRSQVKSAGHCSTDYIRERHFPLKLKLHFRS